MISDLRTESHVQSAAEISTAWDSELIVITGDDCEHLLEQIGGVLSTTQRAVGSPTPLLLQNLAYTLTQRYCDISVSGQGEKHRVAIVASSLQELQTKLVACRNQIGKPGCSSIYDDKSGVYYTCPSSVVNGELGFIYPGLGSAYANMLSELRDHFPQVRRVFEIVDSVAMSAGAEKPPSASIFSELPPAGESGAKSLAAADFAVVAVLLAEYALHEFLKNLEVTADVLIGCSTGEFAAITTGGAIEVLSAAETFYKLSTGVASSIASAELQDLRSLHVFADWSKVESVFTERDIYLTADLARNHIMVTGSRSSVDEASAILRTMRINSFPLSFAIPYHTPLVSGIVDSNQSEVRSIEIEPFKIPAWSCSTGAPYPTEPEDIRNHLTQLFMKPIAFRQTIESVYAKGVRVFVEVGPNNVLTTLVKEILAKSPHVAVAANMASRSSLCQILHMLGVLFTQGIPANLKFLYADRNVNLVPDERLSEISWPDGSIDERFGHSISAHEISHHEISGHEVHGELHSDTEQVLLAFLEANAALYSQSSAVHQSAMEAYLAISHESDSHVDDSYECDSSDDGGFGYSTGNQSTTITRLSLEYPAKHLPCAIVEVRDARSSGTGDREDYLRSYLHLEEQEFCDSRKWPEKRRTQWLAGRVAAKEAARELLVEQHGSALDATAIMIRNNESGCPQIELMQRQPTHKTSLRVSITHTSDTAFALVVPSEVGSPGIDAEYVRPREPDFASTFLTNNELDYINNCAEYLRDVEVTRFWCAKEALVKAFEGLVPFSSIEIVSCSPGEKVLSLRVLKKSGLYTVWSGVRNGLVIAQTLI